MNDHLASFNTASAANGTPSMRLTFDLDKMRAADLVSRTREQRPVVAVIGLRPARRR
ncbi:MAG: hypothetical protein HYV09_16265 [Deltaproteobacteria bacterium]|nr:hypothetical protein [Deltaproteobacteria bacterium]